MDQYCGRVSVGKVVKAASRMDKFPKDLLKEAFRRRETKKESSEKPANYNLRIYSSSLYTGFPMEEA